MIKKIISILIIVLFVCISIYSISYANGGFIDDMGHDINRFGKETDMNSENFTNKVGTILGAVKLIGTILSVGTIMVVGIKYMTTSVEQKAEYKKTFVTFIIGAFLLFTVTFLPSFIYDLVHEEPGPDSSLVPSELR